MSKLNAMKTFNKQINNQQIIGKNKPHDQSRFNQFYYLVYAAVKGVKLLQSAHACNYRESLLCFFMRIYIIYIYT